MKKKITVITLFIMVFALCLRVEAQQSKKIPRIGYLAPRSAVPDEFIQGLRQLGYVAGQNIRKSFRSAAQENSQGVYAAFRHAPILSGINQLVALAIKSQLPTIFSDRAFVEAGGLLSYGTSFGDLYRRQAVYVDKILKGVHPAELPVEQPTQFELVINLKTAKQIGLAISQKLLARADKVIK